MLFMRIKDSHFQRLFTKKNISFPLLSSVYEKYRQKSPLFQDFLIFITLPPLRLINFGGGGGKAKNWCLICVFSTEN